MRMNRGFTKETRRLQHLQEIEQKFCVQKQEIYIQHQEINQTWTLFQNAGDVLMEWEEYVAELFGIDRQFAAAEEVNSQNSK